jgi:hypothetical protein
LFPLSHGRSVVPRSPRPLAQYAPLFSAPLSALDFRSRPRTRPPSFLFLYAPSPHTPPIERTPSPSSPLFPTQAHTGSAPWPTLSPPCDPLVIPLHATSTTGALRHHRHPSGYKIPPCLPLLHSTPRSGVELIVSTSSVSTQVGEAWEAVRKKVVGGRAMRSSRCS